MLSKVRQSAALIGASHQRCNGSVWNEGVKTNRACPRHWSRDQ